MTKRGLRRLENVVKHPLFTVATAAIAITSLTMGIQNSNERAHQAEQRNTELRQVLCGVFQPIGSAPAAPTRTELGTRLVNEANRSVELLGCTPDLTDGK